MRYWKMRVFGLALIIVCAGLLYYEWQRLSQEGRYSMKVATFAPLCVVGGIFMLLFPTRAGRPETVSDKLAVFLVLILGLAAGVLNLYLMDPGFFSFR